MNRQLINQFLFTNQNTENFSGEILNKMNQELISELETIDCDELDVDFELIQYKQEKIFNKYC